ncbi:GNAT family N-acetyltransferase [Paraliobacillus zengyii]|uniref:GNAT family N-acetyltransferase n=1 Tax=Paraliobacillus zengyii TaxID=2213194 RepID=UPI000E3DE300|nr:GNAT family N-acetyltransferase [Paraliobacillus zengyii]
MELIIQGNTADSDYIREQIIAYNMEQLPDSVKTAKQSFCFKIEDPQTKKIIAGITATAFWYHLHIDFLWVDSNNRGKGYGRQLLKRIEETAKENQCRLLFLDSFSFQAPDFYKKQGYQMVGKIEDHPEGYSLHFLEKRLK